VDDAASGCACECDDGQTMFFASHAIVSYIAFSIYQYQGGELTMPRISYVLAMLHLPKLSLANFFVRGKPGLALETFSRVLHARVFPTVPSSYPYHSFRRALIRPTDLHVNPGLCVTLLSGRLVYSLLEGCGTVASVVL